MLSELYIPLIAILTFDGFLMAFLMWAVQSDRYKSFRIRTPKTYRIPKSKKYKNVAMNMGISVVLIFGVLGLFQSYLVYDGEASVVLIVGEVIASLLLYDFLYYFMHRNMHNPKFMKFVHGTHHYVRFPTAFESLYVHPVEGISGLLLLLISTAIIGPVSVASFLIIFFIHSTVNILVHSNLDIPHPAMRLFNFWAQKHDIHHGKHLNKNYASITPFWDFLFGTYA